MTSGGGSATDMDLLLALASHARHRPERAAVVFESEQRSYRELAQRVSLFAAAFEARGCRPGERVGVATYSGVLPVELYLAAQAAELQPVMLSWTLGAAIPRIAALLGVRHLFAGPEVQQLPDVADAAPAGAIWDVAADPHSAGGFVPGATVGCERWVDRRRPPEQISGIQFSAGSTGTPKAILRTVRGDVWDGWQKALAFQARAGDRWLCITPRNLGVLAGALRPMLLLGGTVQFLRQFSADATLDATLRDGVTILPLQTPHWRELLAHAAADKLATTSVRTLVATGQRTPVGLARAASAAFADAHLVVNYGTSESSTVAVLPATDPSFGLPSCVGAPLPTIRVEVVDADDHALPAGRRGEIRLQGPSVIPGYDPALGPAAPDAAMRDGWFHTGDVGEWDAAGNLYVVDRWADVFEVSGRRVYPGEVQEELFRLPTLRDVAVAGVDGPHGARRPTVFVVAAADFAIEHVTRALADVSPVTFDIRVVERLPKTLGGKLDRAALRKGTW